MKNEHRFTLPLSVNIFIVTVQLELLILHLIHLKILKV